MKRIFNWFASLFKHKHTFLESDVRNLNIDPKCTCGKTLSELCKELGI